MKKIIPLESDDEGFVAIIAVVLIGVAVWGLGFISAACDLRKDSFKCQDAQYHVPLVDPK